jgi:hypothetical protein
MGDMFADPRALNKGFTNECPSCKGSTDNFVLATPEDILKQGFTKDEYF